MIKRWHFLSVAIILLVMLATVIGVSTNAHAATVCTPTSTITGPFAQDGVGDLCFQTASLCTYINSWNVSALEVNGNVYTNLYVASNTIAPLNGSYIIHYVSTVAWGHFEFGGTCSGSGATATPTRTVGASRTATQGSGPTATRTPTQTVGASRTPTAGPTSTRSRTPTAFAETSAPTSTRTRTPTAGPSATRTRTPTTGPALTPTRTATRTMTNTPTKTVGASPTRTATITSTVVATGCGSLAICDGFESGTVGAAPSGSWQVIYPNCSGTGTVVVDSAQAHGGTKSVRVDGKTGYCNHVFFGNTTNMAGIGPVVYGRVYLRVTNALGTDHVTFMAMKDVNDSSKDLRFGGQGQVMAWNRESDDATVPSMSPVGISTSAALPVNQWSCLEFKVDGNNGFLQAWLNGVEVPGLAVDGVSTADIDAQWLSSRPSWHPSLSDIKLGWESYSSGDNTLWFDDVAFGANRVGCGG